MDHGISKRNKKESSMFLISNWSKQQQKLIHPSINKNSASDRYLHYTSTQAWHEKAAAIHTLTLRALNCSSAKELLWQELSHITQVFLDNGLPLPAIQCIIKMKLHRKVPTDFENLEETHVDQTPIDFSRVFYGPSHPPAWKLFETLQMRFGITSM